jgi:hypothetical protein
MLATRHLDPKTRSFLFPRVVFALLAAMLLSLPSASPEDTSDKSHV